MTLKEKFLNASIIEGVADNSEVIAATNAMIADDYAIEFAHWCEWQDGKAFKTFEELLEIFKKEKGL